MSDGLRTGGAGGVDVLDCNGGLGWQLLELMMAPAWEDRPSAQECLEHPFWTKRIVI